MKSTIYPIQTPLTVPLAIVSRPNGGDWLVDEIRDLAERKIDILVSMLEPHEAQELGLEEEGNECNRSGIRFVNIPVQDRSIPADQRQFLKIVDELVAELRRGKSIGVHCRACIGRSSVFAASLLVRLGMSPEEAFKCIEAARGRPVPDTPEQHAWVKQNISETTSRDWQSLFRVGE